MLECTKLKHMNISLKLKLLLIQFQLLAFPFLSFTLQANHSLAIIEKKKKKNNDYHLNVISRKIDETNKANRFANKANRFAPSSSLLLLFRCCDEMRWLECITSQYYRAEKKRKRKELKLKLNDSMIICVKSFSNFMCISSSVSHELCGHAKGQHHLTLA